MIGASAPYGSIQKQRRDVLYELIARVLPQNMHQGRACRD
jgi:hypothetical protein